MAISDELLNTTVSIIADYREGEINRPDATHVERWLGQFDEPVRQPLLSELNHVLAKTYVSKSGVERFLSKLVKLSNWLAPSHESFG